MKQASDLAAQYHFDVRQQDAWQCKTPPWTVLHHDSNLTIACQTKKACEHAVQQITSNLLATILSQRN